MKEQSFFREHLRKKYEEVCKEKGTSRDLFQLSAIGPTIERGTYRR